MGDGVVFRSMFFLGEIWKMVSHSCCCFFILVVCMRWNPSSFVGLELKKVFSLSLFSLFRSLDLRVSYTTYLSRY